MDWGLLRTKEAGKYGLRPKIKYPAKFYYFAIVTNALLRFWWVISIFPYPFTTPVGEFVKDWQVLSFLSMLAEIVRRTQWALIRVENEFFNNFEKYRTIQIIPRLMDEVQNTYDR